MILYLQDLTAGLRDWLEQDSWCTLKSLLASSERTQRLSAQHVFAHCELGSEKKMSIKGQVWCTPKGMEQKYRAHSMQMQCIPSFRHDQIRHTINLVF